MALYDEEKQTGNGIWVQTDLNDHTPNVGDSMGFYFVSTDTRHGEDGEFMIVNGLKVNLGATNFDDMVSTAEPINFVPRMVLEKKIEEGNFSIGGLYRLEKTINRGDKYKGKKVRYFAWDLYIVNAPKPDLDNLNKKVLELQGKDTVAGNEEKVEQPEV